MPLCATVGTPRAPHTAITPNESDCVPRLTPLALQCNAVARRLKRHAYCIQELFAKQHFGVSSMQPVYVNGGPSGQWGRQHRQRTTPTDGKRSGFPAASGERACMRDPLSETRRILFMAMYPDANQKPGAQKVHGERRTVPRGGPTRPAHRGPSFQGMLLPHHISILALLRHSPAAVISPAKHIASFASSPLSPSPFHCARAPAAALLSIIHHPKNGLQQDLGPRSRAAFPAPSKGTERTLACCCPNSMHEGRVAQRGCVGGERGWGYLEGA